ncbi:MAG: hypothetical protein NC489_43655 [Ruminococcus flavefaciens]|nr:hypothetical protein [Ruminococcus flavefaciens]
MYMVLYGIILTLNCVNNGGCIRNECHFSLKNNFYLGAILLPDNVSFSPNNQQLRMIARAYAEMIGLVPIATSNVNKKRN